jgi:phospholipid/cholesterol/gamma-HCH transport system substrate-binding protein
MDKANDIDEILTSLKTTIDNTSNVTSNLSKITDSIQSGKGAIGTLLMDPAMKKNIDSTVVNLKESSAELKILLEKAKDSWMLWGF